MTHGHVRIVGSRNRLFSNAVAVMSLVSGDCVESGPGYNGDAARPRGDAAFLWVAVQSDRGCWMTGCVGAMGTAGLATFREHMAQQFDAEGDVLDERVIQSGEHRVSPNSVR